MQIAKAELSPSEMAEAEAVTTIYREDTTVTKQKVVASLWGDATTFCFVTKLCKIIGLLR